MLDREQRLAVVNKDWRIAYPMVAAAAKEVLLADGGPFTTTALVESLWPTTPDTLSVVFETTGRARVRRALVALAKHEMQGWCKTEQRFRKAAGAKVNVLVWSAPPQGAVCPHCGRPL